MTEAEKIVKFLKSHPLLSIRGLEKELNLYNGAINNALIGRKPLPYRHILRIVEVLKDYGYTNDKM